MSFLYNKTQLNKYSSVTKTDLCDLCVAYSAIWWRQLPGHGHAAADGPEPEDHDVAAEPVHGGLWHPLRRHHTGALYQQSPGRRDGRQHGF